MNNDSSTENRVGDRVKGAGGERGDGEGDEGDGDQALEGPVVGAVSRIGIGDGGGLVDITLNDLWPRRQNLHLLGRVESHYTCRRTEQVGSRRTSERTRGGHRLEGSADGKTTAAGAEGRGECGGHRC